MIGNKITPAILLGNRTLAMTLPCTSDFLEPQNRAVIRSSRLKCRSRLNQFLKPLCMNFARVFTPFFFALVSIFPLQAQQPTPADTSTNPVFKGMTWRNIGPTRGGRSLGVAGSPGRKLEYYFGAVGGGLWKTTDGGSTWAPVTDGQIRSSSVGAVAVAESNPDVVYIGTGETQLRGNIMQGDGVYKSTNAGKTWKNIGLSNTQAIARVRIHPTNPNIVYVAALGHPYGPNEERGIFRTTDGGTTWKKVLYKSDKAGGVIFCQFLPWSRVMCNRPSSEPAQIVLTSWNEGARANTVA